MHTTRLVLAFTFVAGAAAFAQQPAAAPPPRQGPPPRAQAMGPGGAMHDMPGMQGMQGMQGGPGMQHPGGPAGGIASTLLAHTGELKLTDAQVTKLAAIARRTDERHRGMRAMMDSMMRANRPQPGAAPGAAPHTMPDMPNAMMERMQAQERADLRDALAVLTIDQQADAWMMHDLHRGGGPAPMAARGRHPRG